MKCSVLLSKNKKCNNIYSTINVHYEKHINSNIYNIQGQKSWRDDCQVIWTDSAVFETHKLRKANILIT